MAKERPAPASARPPRKKLSAAESVKRAKEFAKRKDQFVAAVRTRAR